MSYETAQPGFLAQKRGWHAKQEAAPHAGKGSATVEPIRTRKDLLAIAGVLASRPRDFTLFAVGIHFGLRGSDLLTLRWYDVLDDTGHVRPVVEIIEAKTGNHRRIAVSAAPRRALERWRKENNPIPEALVFPSRDGGPMTIQRLHQLVNEWTCSANVKGHFGAHTLRKTYGFFQHQQGIGIERLMKIFGHSSQSITLRYIGIEQAEIDEANLKLNLL